MRRALQFFVAAVAFSAFAPGASADTIVAALSTTDFGTFFPGQSLTTPPGGSWNNLIFNWFAIDGTPTAAGMLYLFTQEYLGTPPDLSSGAPGLLAVSSPASGGMYVFAPTVTLYGATQYYFYSDTSLTLTGSQVDILPGGDIYAAFTSDANFSKFAGQDANFILASDAVPEPSWLVLMGAGLFGIVAFARRSGRSTR